MEEKSGQWLGGTLQSTGKDGKVVVSHMQLNLSQTHCGTYSFAADLKLTVVSSNVLTVCPISIMMIKCNGILKISQ